MELTLGTLFRELTFFEIYKTLASNERYDEMLADGWFPFVAMNPNEYHQLTEAYENKFNFENKTTGVIEKFSETRINEMTSLWWTDENFEAKRTILQAGINAYIQNDPDGMVTCIKILGTEIEGLLRMIYRTDTGKGKIKVNQLLVHITDKARAVAGSDHSLLMAVPFLDYLRGVVFANFDVEAGEIELSRNTVGHGVAQAEQYTKARALQMILVLDQIYFFSESPSGH